MRKIELLALDYLTKEDIDKNFKAINNLLNIDNNEYIDLKDCAGHIVLIYKAGGQ